MASIPGAVEETAPLLKWATLHMFALQLLSAQELRIFEHPYIAPHVLFSVFVRARPEEKSRKKRFFITHASPYPIALTGPNVARVREAYALASAGKGDKQGTYLISIMSEEILIPYLIPIGFDLNYRLPGRGKPQVIISIINSGIVF